jgi:hypothetical protein
LTPAGAAKKNPAMKTKIALATIAAVAGLAPAFAADPTPGTPTTGASPNEADMMKQMMEMGKPGENQKLLAQFVGTWNYTVKYSMAPGTPPSESKGKATCSMTMGGRYLMENVSGKMEMPGPDGKMKEAQFRGLGIDAYDNAKQKFVASWIDNMGTGIVNSEGTYDAATKTFTYNSEEEMAPGTTTKVRETLQITDKDHHLMQWFENRGGQEVKTMEISYTRAK